MTQANDPSTNKTFDPGEPSAPSARDSNRSQWLVVIVVGMTILGCIGGLGVFYIEMYWIPQRQWSKLSSPPEAVTELLGFGKVVSNQTECVIPGGVPGQQLYVVGEGACDQAVVYVRTDSQDIYACPWSSPTMDCVQVTSQKLQEGVQNCGLPGPFMVPPPPGEVVNRVEADPCTCFGSCKEAVVVLKDGSLWEYFAQEGEWSSLGLYFRGCVGTGIGFLGSIMLIVMIASIIAVRDLRRPSRSSQLSSNAHLNT